MSSVELTGTSPFTEEETQAMTDLLAAYDGEPRQFFDTFEKTRIATDFRLYHLRYVLRLDGCEAHWARLAAIVAETPASWRANGLMQDPTVARLWQVHYCRHGQVHELMASYETWLQRTQAERDGGLCHTVLRQYAYLYHHQFARRQFDRCGEVAMRALTLFKGAKGLEGWFKGEQHPYDESIRMPIHRARYWEYLAAVAAVERRRRGGELSTHAQAILADEDRWRCVQSLMDIGMAVDQQISQTRRSWRARSAGTRHASTDWGSVHCGNDHPSQRPGHWGPGARSRV